MRKAILYTFFILTIAACAEPEIKDPLVGEWRYESTDFRGRPAIIAKFSVYPAGNSYHIGLISMSINGSQPQNLSMVVSDIVTGDKIGKIKVTNGDVIVEFNDLDQLGVYPAWYIKQIQLELNNQVHTYPGGSLERD